MTGTPVISLRDIRKSYGSFELGPVDLEIEPGYFVAVVGPNGGGKSTLFRVLMNLVQPSSGELELFGGAYPHDEVEIKQRVGYVPERSLGHDEMSANSLGEFFSRFYPGWDGRLYEDLLKRTQVEPDKKFGKLSKGVQRRLAFALALATGVLIAVNYGLIAVSALVSRIRRPDLDRPWRMPLWPVPPAVALIGVGIALSQQRAVDLAVVAGIVAAGAVYYVLFLRPRRSYWRDPHGLSAEAQEETAQTERQNG